MCPRIKPLGRALLYKIELPSFEGNLSRPVSRSTHTGQLQLNHSEFPSGTVPLQDDAIVTRWPFADWFPVRIGPIRAIFPRAHPRR
jgi:hypothetical protein